MDPLGRRRWAIAEGYIPSWSNGPEPQFISHETACLLNAGDKEARVEVTIFFEDREPAGPYRLTVPARRTKHVRFNEPTDPEPIPGAHTRNPYPKTPTTRASRSQTCRWWFSAPGSTPGRQRTRCSPP